MKLQTQSEDAVFVFVLVQTMANDIKEWQIYQGIHGEHELTLICSRNLIGIVNVLSPDTDDDLCS